MPPLNPWGWPPDQNATLDADGLLLPDGTVVPIGDIADNTVLARVGGSIVGVTDWPAPAAATIDYYVDGVAGNDNNAGTLAAPFATLAKVDAVIPTTVQAIYNVHLKAQTYPLPARDYWLRARTYIKPGVSRIQVFADATWDPTVFTVAIGQNAAAGTTAAKVVGAGLVVNAHAGRTIRFTSGPAAGYYRRINSNTATDILVDLPWTAGHVPVAGNAFEILTLNTAINAPAAADGISIYQIAANQNASGALSEQEYFPLSFTGYPGTGLFLAALKLTSTPGYAGVHGGTINLTGVDIAFPLYATNTQINSGVLGAFFEGWGVNGRLLLTEYGSFVGYLYSSGAQPISTDYTSVVRLFGGAYTGLLSVTQGRLNISGDAATPFQVGGFTLQNPTAFAEVARAISTSSWVVTGGATLRLFSSVTGAAAAGNSMTIAGNGRVLCNGAPAYGGAGNDWATTGIANYNKAALAAVGGSKIGTDNSIATRTI